MPRWALGVDLGTSFCAAAIATADRVEILEVGRERQIPSTVLLDDSGRLVAGVFAQRQLGKAPERAERNPKRYVGRGVMLLGGVPVEARDAMAALLNIFVTEARARFDGSEPDAIVLTHPVAWSQERRAVLRSAAALVLPDARIRLIEEPVAAAVHYAASHKMGQGRFVAVYDLGGGTFDSAVLAVSGSGFTVVGTPGGDDEIGGESFDERVYGHFGEQLKTRAPQWWEQASTSPERRWLAAAAELLVEARVAKETLSEYETASQYVTGADVDVEITRTELENLIGTEVVRTVDILTETIRGANVAATDLAGIFLTGGASRMPLVQQSLRNRYSSQVRTWDDPKIVVALGAARLAWQHAGDAAPEPAEESTRSRDLLDVRLDGVSSARASSAGVYACTPGGDGTVGVLHRIDPETGKPDRQLTLGPIVDWAAADEGLIVADLWDGQYRVHTLSPDLAIRISRSLPTTQPPQVLAQGGVGWIFYQTAAASLVDNLVGLPWGRIAQLTAVELDLANVFMRDSAPTALEPNSMWFVNEDGKQRRLLDQTSPSGSVPALVGAGGGFLVVLGQFSSDTSAPPAQAGRLPGMRARVSEPVRHQNVVPWQVACMVSPGGDVKRFERRTPGWLHQAIHHKGHWFLATSSGLEAGTDVGPATLVAPRPRNGTARWVRAGDRMYAVTMEHAMPARGLSIGVLDDGAPMRWLLADQRSHLLGHLSSTDPAEVPRIVADSDGLWLAASGEPGRSRLLRVEPTGVSEVATASGWLEPVGRVPSGLLCLHDPATPPGTRRSGPAQLVHIAL